MHLCWYFWHCGLDIRPRVEYYLNIPKSTFLTFSFKPPLGRHKETFSIVTFFSIIKSPPERFSVWIMWPFSLGSISSPLRIIFISCTYAFTVLPMCTLNSYRVRFEATYIVILLLLTLRWSITLMVIIWLGKSESTEGIWSIPSFYDSFISFSMIFKYFSCWSSVL